MLAEWFMDDDGEFKVRIDGVVHPADAAVPNGPIGDDPEAFAPFGVGAVDREQLLAALRGKYASPDLPRVRAEVQHWNIVTALNLAPEPMTVGFRHVEESGLSGVRVGGSA